MFASGIFPSFSHFNLEDGQMGCRGEKQTKRPKKTSIISAEIPCFPPQADDSLLGNSGK